MATSSISAIRASVPWMQEESILACLPVCKSWHKKLNRVFAQAISDRRLSRYQRPNTDLFEGAFSYSYPVIDLETKATCIMKRHREAVHYRVAILEASILKQLLGKEHIIQIDRSFFSNKSHYVIVMEHFQAPDLQKQWTSFEKKDILSIAKQFLTALTKLEGVIHGDLKPSNILWDKNKGALKLIDFGLSRICKFRQKNTAYPNVLVSSS